MDIQRLRLIIDSAPAAEGAAAWGRYTRQVGSDAQAATGHITRMESAIDSTARSLRTLAGAAGITFGAAKVIEYADSYKRLEGQLKLVSTSQGEVLKAERDLFEMSNRTRSSYEATASLYVKVAQNARELGRTQGEVLRFTETVQKAIQIGGSGAQEARAGVIQLGQALGSGVLRGDEFRSVMENMRGVSQTLAQGLGVTVGQLRNMANNGELTAQKVVDAMLRMSDVVDERFKKVPVTIAGAFTVADNEVRRWIGETDRGLGASNALAGGIILIAKNVGLLANAALLFAGAKLAGVISGMIGPTIREAAALATGNAVLRESQAAYVMRAAAAKESAAAVVTASQTAAAGLRTELAEVTALQMAERRRFAEASTRVRAAVPESQLAPLGGAVMMRDNAAVVLAMKQRAESEILLAELMARRGIIQRDLTAIEAVGTAATRLGTAANIQRAMALNVSTGALLAEAAAARIAAAATGMFNGAMALVGGSIGAAVLALMLWVGWLFKKQNAEAEAIDKVTEHTAMIRQQKSALDALHAAMSEDLTDIDKLQVALDRGGIKQEARAQAEIKSRDLARKYWKSYQEALVGDNSMDAALARELTLDQATRSSSATVRAAAKTRIEMAGLVVGAQLKLDEAEDRSRKATEKATAARDAATTKLKEESAARVKAAADLDVETQAARTNADVAGQAKTVREAWAVQARISVAIHKAHAMAVEGDTEEVLLAKAALRDQIAVQMVEIDTIERMTKAQNSLRDARDDIELELANAKALADAYTQGADAVERIKNEQSADAAIRRITNGLTKEQVAAMQEELAAYRAKLILLGQLNLANTSAAGAAKQEIQATRAEARQEANETEQLMKNALRGAQAAAASFFESLVTGGVNSFQRIVDAARSMFVKLFAELAAQKLGSAVMGMLGASPRLLRGGSMGNGPGIGTQALGYAGIGLGAFSVGYGVGQNTGSYGGAALGGAASGALTGAAIGSVVPVIGTPVGAVVGAVAGLVGGLIGHSAKLKAEAKELAKSRVEFFTELDKFVYGLGQHSTLEKGLHDLTSSLLDLHKRATELKLTNQDLAKLDAAASEARARMKQEYLDSIDAQINAAGGQGYMNQALDFQKAYQQNLKDIALAGGNTSKAAELMVRQFDQLGDSLSASDLQALLDNLPNLTKGMDPELVKRLAGVLGDDLTKALKALSDSASEAAEGMLRANEDLRVRFARASGNPLANDMARSFSQRQAVYDATAAGASPEYLAQLKLVQLFETAQALVERQTANEIKAIQDSTAEELRQLDVQTKVAQDQLAVAEDAVHVAQQNLTATQRVVDSLAAYGKTLLVGQYSPLSGVDQVEVARQQVVDAFTKGMGGDRESAMEFQQLSTAFLDVLRTTYASSGTYTAGFESVQDMLDQLSDKYGAQASLEQETLDAAQAQVDLLTTHLDMLEALKTSTREAADEQIAAIQEAGHQSELVREAVVAALTAQQDALQTAADAQITKLEELQAQNDAALAVSNDELANTANLYTQALIAGDAAAAGIFQQLQAQMAVRDKLDLAHAQLAAELATLQETKAAAKSSSDAEIAAILDMGATSDELNTAANMDAADAIVASIDAAKDFENVGILAVRATLDGQRLDYNTKAIEQINAIRHGNDLTSELITSMELTRVNQDTRLKEIRDALVGSIDPPGTDGTGWRPIVPRFGLGRLPTGAATGADASDTMAELLTGLIEATDVSNELLTRIASINSSVGQATVEKLKAANEALTDVSDQLRLSITGV